MLALPFLPPVAAFPLAPRPRPAAEVLGPRSLNRALLARQLLLARSRLGTAEALEHLVGLQSQDPLPPYFGLWTRLEGFAPQALSELIASRRAVRLTLMRGTVHVVTAPDALRLRPWVQPALERHLRGAQGKKLAGLDVGKLVAVSRALLEEEPRTLARLGEALAARWPRRDKDALVLAARLLLPLVQVPPRGLWDGHGQATCTTLEAWVGAPLAPQPDLDALVERYLGAFGPASVQDAQSWSGLTRLREVFERLRPRLRTFVGEDGTELFDLPQAPRPGPDAPAPVRLLPPWDNALLSHADRRRILGPLAPASLLTDNGILPGTVLVDGFVRGTWKLTREKTGARLEVAALAPFTRAERAQVGEEAERLLAFAAPEAPRAQLVLPRAR